MSKYALFDRNKLNLKSVKDRISKSDISIMINPELDPPKVSAEEMRLIKRLAECMKESKKRGSPIIVAYGAHLFKNGCSPIMIRLMELGYVQQILTNGAGIIHDFEMAYMGKTEEDVRNYIKQGQFGLWDETGRYLNKCMISAAREDKGYGEKVGEFISTGKIDGEIVEFPYKQYSIISKAYELNVPFSSCVCIGQDIIHTHPLCDGAALGKSSYTDFLIFANTVSHLEGGVMLSIGSAILAPMVFEKSISMAKNLARQRNEPLENYTIFVNDMQPGSWDWKKGEPPKDHPAYYLRFCKSFSRAGGDFTYLCLDNRKFIHNLYWLLKGD